MIYHLSGTGLGLAVDKAPFPDFGKVKFTFQGESADYVCVCGEFHPIIDGTAEVATASLPDRIPVAAYSLSDGRRYTCDTLVRIGPTGSEKAPFLAPAPDGDAEIVTILSDKVAALEARLHEVKARLDAHEKLIFGNPITFGGTYETNKK